LLDHHEFMRLSAAHQLQEPAEESLRCLREAFDMYAEEEETAVITPASLRRMLRRLGSEHQRLEMEECRAMICRFDLNGDGVLSFDEFRVMMLMA
jgi:calcium-binding protein CML